MKYIYIIVAVVVIFFVYSIYRETFDVSSYAIEVTYCDSRCDCIHRDTVAIVLPDYTNPYDAIETDGQAVPILEHRYGKLINVCSVKVLDRIEL